MDYQDLFPVPVEWLDDVDVSMAQTSGAWAEAEVIAGRLEHKEDYDALLLPAMRKLCRDVGLQSMLMPEGLGGGGLGAPEAAMTLTVVLEQVARADVGIAFLLANSFAVQSAFAVGPDRDEALLEQAAPAFCGDDVTIAALVLPYYSAGAPEAPSFFGLPYQGRAVKSADGWTVSSASARPQCAGATAAYFGLAAALDDGTPGLFLVPSVKPGVGRGKPFKKAGLAASINADVTLGDVSLPDSHLVARGSEGLRAVLSWYYTLCSAVCSGALLANHAILKEWGDTRVIKGKGQVFKENPLTASLMGEIGARTGTARLLTYDLARMVSRPGDYGPPGGGAVSTAATSVFRQVAGQAMDAMDNTMELMASAGYATEWNLERYWRDIQTMVTCVAPETVTLTDAARHYFDLKRL